MKAKCRPDSRKRTGAYWVALCLSASTIMYGGCDSLLDPLAAQTTASARQDFSTFLQEFAREALAAFLF